MFKRVLIYLYMVCMTVGYSGFLRAEQSKLIVLAADEWCPYNCSPEDKAKPGYMIEIAQAVFSKAGYKVEYRVMPFQRALQEVLKGGIDGAVGMDPETAKEAVDAYRRIADKEVQFANSPLMGVVNVSFYTPGTSQWIFDPANAEASMKALGGKVGVPQGYSYDISPLLKKLGLLVEIAGDAPMAQLLKMMDSGRISAVIDDDAVINYVANTNGLAGKVRYAGAAGEPLDIYVGFNAAHQDYADILTKGLEDMRQNGDLARILQKYNIKDWKH